MNLSKLRNLSIKKKLVVLFLLIGILFIVITGSVGYFELDNLEQETLKTTSKDLRVQLKNSIDAKEKVWLTNSLQIASNPIIKEAMAKGDRQACITMLNKYSQTFKENTGFNNIKVHLIDNQLNSFVKSWNKNSFGESLVYSDAYQKVKNSKEPMVVTEESPKGLRLKALFPVYYQQKFVGMVNFEGGLNSIKRTLKPNKIDFLYLLKDDYLDIAKGINNKTKIAGYTLSQKDVNQEFLSEVTNNLNLEKALQNYTFTDNYLVTAQKIKTVGGEEVGVYLLGQNKDIVMEAVNDSKNIVYVTYLSFFIVFILLVVVIFWFINKNINEPLSSLIDSVKKFTDGNLKEEINLNRKDEIGLLGTKLEEMRKNLKEVIGEIFKGTEDLSAYSEELSASAQEGNATIETTNDLVEDISASIEEISASAEEITSFAQESNAKTETGSKNIKETLNSIDEINQSTSEAVEIINELDNTSKEIDKIVEMITDIAEQTNLLALNASIEAARAGEAGEGFAVVAEEIRELAEGTNDATNEIANLINKTQNKADDGLKAIKEVHEKATKGQRNAKETKEIFTEIQGASEETAVQIKQTASATQDLAEKSEQVSSNTDGIQNMSNEVTNSSQELAKMAQELQELVSRFKL
ncbi:methyl-accepting chemotaxis protein [Selenihalanaerobacter shriftii]|uniref:Methyl-accepting chemotaxis protein n=1 Tax=Selenihalanaerobacter shriftii TaxID=142842 RepID=A0A1T4LLI8_9FIRM|nr:methyl-accepting chemotaxis protein [Selenihalanaerobacter shriftii]SJZ55314.1 methyl-accepting chemotaxis protein [Selenihalanaerobacter shriftii]